MTICRIVVVLYIPEELDARLTAALDVVGLGQGGPLVQQDTDDLVVVLQATNFYYGL